MRAKEIVVAGHYSIRGQLKNLRKRIVLIRNMQALGVASLLFCVLCMLVMWAGAITLGNALFAISLTLLVCSLLVSLYEILISVTAIDLELRDLLTEEEKSA